MMIFKTIENYIYFCFGMIISGLGVGYLVKKKFKKTQPEINDFQEIVDFIKENDGKFTKQELWEEYKKQKGVRK